MDDSVDSMRIGGFAMLALAASELVEKFVVSFWLDLDKSTGSTLGTAFFEVLLGVGMLQGSNAARKVVLFLSGLSGVALLLLLAALFAAGFSRIWPIPATALAMMVGVFILNLSTEQRRSVVIGALGLILLGWAGSILASIQLVGSVDLADIQAIRQWSLPQRSFEDAEAGVSMRVPPRWVVLKEGSPVAADQKPLLALANTEIQCTARLSRETRTYSVVDNLEFLLDGIAKTMGGQEAEFTTLARADTRIAGFPARRMKVSWRKGDQERHASITAWQDGDLFYTLFVTAPRVITKRLDQEVVALEQSLAFTAPWTNFLREKAASVRKTCPLLSDAILIPLARALSKESAPEMYCREAYRLAYAGQAQMDATSSERLRSAMKGFFGALPAARRERFGAYVERLRARQPTSAAEDREMALATQQAMEALSPDAQAELRRSFAMAVDMGRFAGHVGAQ